MRISTGYLFPVGVLLASSLCLPACTANREREPTRPEPGPVTVRQGRSRDFWAAGKFTYEGGMCFFTEPGDTIPLDYPCGEVYVGVDSAVDSLEAETLAREAWGKVSQRNGLGTGFAYLVITVPRRKEQSALLKLYLLDHVRFAEVLYAQGVFTDGH